MPRENDVNMYAWIVDINNNFMLSYVDSELFLGTQMDDKRWSIKLSIEPDSQRYMKDKCEHDELVPVCAEFVGLL